mmetsp:Transcript_802/g.1147  ORF Transcript_802/g.1147 Transcript_802/m.1147 type:complete len:104 (+) Transcript_802:314-625(+)
MQRIRKSHQLHPKLEELTDKVMLGLRLREGLDIESIAVDYGTDAVDSILKGAETAIAMGHAKLDIDKDSGNIERFVFSLYCGRSTTITTRRKEFPSFKIYSNV